MTKIEKLFTTIFGNLAVYTFTLMGILLSQYAPLLLQQGKISATVQGIRLAISAVIALYIVTTDEGHGEPDGKQKNWKRRMSHAFTQGYTWNGLLGIASQAAAGQ
jgi:hypothetical protein